MSAIHFDSVWKSYGTVEAVRDLNLTCENGEMLALLGPSGCGKSSTLKMVAGIESVTKGEILFDGRPVSALSPGERNIAMVFEDYALYPHLSVSQNIAFPLKVRHAAPREIAARVNDAMALLRLDGVRDENVKSLSGGAQQRVSIGRALVRDPELILFDEPLSHLDADQKVQLRTEIKRLQQTSGLTSILVTHDQTEAVAMSDRVAVMNHGVLEQVGPPQELYDTPVNLFVANFIGEPPMNLLPAETAETDGEIELFGAGWKLRLAAGIAGRFRNRARSPRLVLGVRPEHVDVRPRSTAATEDAARAGEFSGIVFYREPRGDVDVLVVRMRDFGGEPATPVDGSADLISGEIAGPCGLRENDAVTIGIPEERIHLFDADSGTNLMLT